MEVTKDQYGNTVTKYASSTPVDQDTNLQHAVQDLEHQVIDAVANLGELLGRLRRLKLYALDGDEAAVQEALKAIGDCGYEDCGCGIGPLVEMDALDNANTVLDALEKLVAERTERFEQEVPGDHIQDTVQAMVGAARSQDCNVELIEHRYHGRLAPRSGKVTFSRHGRWAEIDVYRFPDDDAESAATMALIKELGLEGAYQEAYQELVQKRGECDAKQIRAAVESVGKGDPAKQIKLFRDAAGL
jgi:hypothetical protein